MQNIQEVFFHIQDIKRKQKTLKKSYKDALSNSFEFNEINDKIKALKERKKQIENTIKSDFTHEFNELEKFKSDIEASNMMMTDIAINKITKGEPVKVKDEHDSEFEPVFSVRFKKIN